MQILAVRTRTERRKRTRLGPPAGANSELSPANPTIATSPRKHRTVAAEGRPCGGGGLPTGICIYICVCFCGPAAARPAGRTKRGTGEGGRRGRRNPAQHECTRSSSDERTTFAMTARSICTQRSPRAGFSTVPYGHCDRIRVDGCESASLSLSRPGNIKRSSFRRRRA